jgi:hypothetical protein
MSVCDLGRPPRDAAVQNLTVNDKLRVNKLLKASKAEIGRLCATVGDNLITLVGSLVYTTEGPLVADYVVYALPSGSTQLTNVNLSQLNNVLYTDTDLVIRKFQASAYTSDALENVNNVDVSLRYGTDTTLLGNTAVSLSLLGTNTPTAEGVNATDSSATATIPAGSFYNIQINEGAGSTNLPDALYSNWTIELDPVA